MAETGTGIRLEFSDGRLPLTSLTLINVALKEVGSCVWPIDLGSAPDDVRQLLKQTNLKKQESTQVVENFELPRERLLDILTQTNRTPHVENGGELTTLSASQNCSYPNLYLIDKTKDYARFDRYHINIAEDGTGTDEFMQIISGGGVSVQQQLPNKESLSLRLHCFSDTKGWLVCYDGKTPHIGSLSHAEAGTKILMQIIGPPTWDIQYTDKA
jgi:hypothetical protein